MAFIDRENPLFFRKDGSLDFGPALLALVSIVAVISFVLTGFKLMSVTVAAWAFFGSFTTICFIAGAAAERAMWIAQSKTPGEVASGIAEVGPEFAIGEPGEPLSRRITDAAQ